MMVCRSYHISYSQFMKLRFGPMTFDMVSRYIRMLIFEKEVEENQAISYLKEMTEIITYLIQVQV